MTREEFISAHPMKQELESRGVKLVGSGMHVKARCPIHKDRNPSMSVDLERGLWNCHAGCGGGSVIDLICKLENKSPKEVLAGDQRGSRWTPPPEAPAPVVHRDPSSPKPTISKIYPYHDALGNEVFQVVRLVPKDFRQRHRGPDGAWVWNMQGIDRVLYRLPHVLKADRVAICEGEKDADTAVSLGLCGTTNVGGGKKWLDGYAEHLAGKEVVIFPDNDKTGKEHQEQVFESLAGGVKSIRVVTVPQPFKDLTEYVESFTELSEAKACIERLIEDAQQFFKGLDVPIFSMAELESRYIQYATNAETEGLRLTKWLPSLAGEVRPLVPGELVLIIGDTGTGKTGILQSIAMAAAPLPTLMFEIELPAELLFERFVASKSRMRASEVERTYSGGDYLGKRALDIYFQNLFICDKASVTPADIESLIIKSELKMGMRPKVVLVDYIQLIGGKGDRYERASETAEALKRIAKATRTIVIVASQRSRPKEGSSVEVHLHSGKDSGSLENSSGLVLGIWRDPDEKSLMHLKVLKNTKGQAGFQTPLHFDGATMTITDKQKL